MVLKVLREWVDSIVDSKIDNDVFLRFEEKKKELSQFYARQKGEQKEYLQMLMENTTDGDKEELKKMITEIENKEIEARREVRMRQEYLNAMAEVRGGRNV